jgi:Mn2+/Fe2+ NRAMP family transporter
MLTLLVANLGTTAAEFSGVAGAAELFGVPRLIGVPVVAVGVWLLVVGGSYKRVERVFLVLSAIYMTYIVSAVLSRPDWRTAARGAAGLEMDWSTGVILFLIVTVGTTVTPWGQFFIQAYAVDKRISIKQYLYTKLEVYSASVFSDLISAFIVIACAATLYREGIVIETAEDAARALAPLAGDFASVLFGIGLLNVSILAAAVLPLTTAYAVCEAFGFESGLDWSFREAPVFYGIITVVLALPALIVLIPELPLIGVILTAQTINGILTPVILVFVLIIVNDRGIMGEHVNSRLYNVLAWSFTAVVVALSLTLVAVTLLG